MKNSISFSNVSDENLRSAWNQKPLYIKQGAVNFGTLITKDEFWQLSQLLDAVGFKEDSKPTHWQDVQPQEAENAFSAGVKKGGSPTIVLGQVEHLHPRTRHLLRWLDVPWQWSRLPTVFMSYSSYDGGIGVHYDDDDNIIIQAVGRRLWRVSTNRNLPSYPDRDGGIELSIKNSSEFILEPGDVLYIPRGYWHEGVTLEESVSVTLGWDSLSTAEVLAHIIAYTSLAGPPKTSTAERYVISVSDDFIPSNSFEIAVNENETRLLEHLPENHRFYELEHHIKASVGFQKRRIPSIAVSYIQEVARLLPNWNLTNEQVLKGYAAFITRPIGLPHIVTHEFTSETVLEQSNTTLLCYSANRESVTIYGYGKYVELDLALEKFCELLCNEYQLSVGALVSYGCTLGLTTKDAEALVRLLVNENFLLVRS